jgi:hypothetical protein
MAIEKTSLIYVYSKDSDIAKYLEFLIDKVRRIEYLDFQPICLEDFKISKAKLSKLQKELDSLSSRTTAEEYSKAVHKRQEIERHKIAMKFDSLHPALIFGYGTEAETIVLGTKMSLSVMLDIFTKVDEGARLISSFNLSEFNSVIKEIGKVAAVAIQNRNAGEGLETTQKHTSVT